jgi:hypothetical protein
MRQAPRLPGCRKLPPGATLKTLYLAMAGDASADDTGFS